ncbi:TRAP transporter substrate-binding protein [Anaerotruncus rubiinfantis]|uniref:TRAP transporter substrate-binding protein n=1 Tax=Anaerotruncus rubiinfantis TaxID=1720200 RepID=UPI0011CB65CD|nr:TRAP transporter substrate-binding protein [Anaerotruncus rubiinfantis]
MKKNLFALLLALSLVLSLAACGGSSAPAASSPPAASSAPAAPAESTAPASGEADYTQGDPVIIKFCTTTAENQPSAHFGKTLQARLDELTGGRIKVEVYFNSEMGKAAELLEGLQLGTVEMTVSTSANLGGFTDAVSLLDLPYLFSCGEAATEAMDGEVGDEILAELESSGFHGLGWVTGNTKLWRLLTANKEIHVPSDLGGIKLRVMNNAIHETTWNTLGASAIPMAFSELYSSLQNGTVDAQENPWGQIQGSKLYEVQKYIIKTEHSYDFSPILISKVFWEGLSPADQELIQTVVDEIIPEERVYTDELQDMAEKEATDYGCTVIELTDEEKAQWVELGRSIYDQFADKAGQDRIDKCIEISAKYA